MISSIGKVMNNELSLYVAGRALKEMRRDGMEWLMAFI